MKRVSQEEHYYAFSLHNKPVLNVRPEETIVVETLDNTGNKIKNEKDSIPSKLNPLSGPIYVEEAKKGDTLVVNVEKINILGNQGWTGQSGVWGTCMSGSELSPILNQPIPTIIKICSIKNGKIKFPLENGKEITIPAAPCIGTIGTAPEVEASTSNAGKHGGNMDSPDLCIGNRLYLPVFANGALLYLGDCHAVQGEGELGGAPVEIPAEVELDIKLIPNKKINWPRIESPDQIMTIGNARPLDDAIRIAASEMVLWLKEDYGFDLWDANLLLNLVGKITVNEVTNSAYSLTVKVPKKYI